MTDTTFGTSTSFGGRRLTATQGLMLRGVGIFAAALLLITSVGVLSARSEKDAPPGAYTGTAMVRELSSLRSSLDRTSGEMELMQLELHRARALLGYSSRYQIPADLAGMIYDTALREGLEPDLAFRLVKVESNFQVRAKSSASAIGLAQVQVRTARFYQPGITLERLYDPETNLATGFRYLRDLLGTYQDNLRLALLAYNRGPAKVNQLLGIGHEPGNGYAKSVMGPRAGRASGTPRR
jgi:soluble lytic murein transglycosylase-like protein